MRHDILLVEDQTLVRKSLTLLIDTCPGLHVAAAVESVQDALALLQSPQPFSLLLCDFNLRGETALDLLQQLNPVTAPPVILLTSLFNAIEVQRCQALGARGFLFKECDPEELVQACHQVLAGGFYFTAAALQNPRPPAFASAFTSSAASSPPARLQLTPAEREILRWLATGMSNKQIALTLGKSSETVKIQVSQLLHKLDCRTRTQAVMKAAQLNLL